MNIKELGIPVYGKGKDRFVLIEDLRLALDKDVYDRFINDTQEILAGADKILVRSLENWHSH